MNKINITLPDNSVHEHNSGVYALDIAKSIGERLSMSTVAATVKDVLVDGTKPINEDASVVIHTADSKMGHDVLLHSAAHVMGHSC
jgi:TGS domain.